MNRANLEYEVAFLDPHALIRDSGLGVRLMPQEEALQLILGWDLVIR